MDLIQNKRICFAADSGVIIWGTVGGKKMTLSTMRDLAETIGDKPGADLDVAWSSYDPEAKALLNAGILSDIGNVRFMGATAGPDCKRFYDEVFETEAWDALREKMDEMLCDIPPLTITMENNIMMVANHQD